MTHRVVIARLWPGNPVLASKAVQKSEMAGMEPGHDG
jgi:hypothetical protein